MLTFVPWLFMENGTPVHLRYDSSYSYYQYYNYIIIICSYLVHTLATTYFMEQLHDHHKVLKRYLNNE